MIPKIIHYVWLGGNTFPNIVKKCIDSWKKICSDYEIKEWNENNFDITSNLYCKQAYEKKMWAFSSDYIRLAVLYNYGGIYLDTDVEIFKTFDNFLNKPAFIGFNSPDLLDTGTIGAEKNNFWVKQMLKYYDVSPFINFDGSFNVGTNNFFITYWTKLLNPNFELASSEYHLKHISVYPQNHISLIDKIPDGYNENNNAYAIHYGTKSWVPVDYNIKEKKWQKFIKEYKKKEIDRIVRIGIKLFHMKIDKALLM